jgi:soluble lytic murein transglycosylase-like protein
LKPHRVLIASLVGALAVCAPASAGITHIVQPGETLWSIAAQNGFTTRSVAAANGLSEDAHVVLGSKIVIPTESEAAVALQNAGVSSAGASSAPATLGSYVVRPGDTLTAIAARSGVTLDAVAFMNGLDPKAPLLTGTVLKLPAGAGISSSGPEPTQREVPNAPPYPTPERVSAWQIGQIAASNGVSASLAKAIGWQESGFNNSLVSSANARGVMQILPGTWSWINSNLALSPLNARSAQDNVHAGVLYLGQLLHDTGGNMREAVAAYYQGLESVRQRGMLPDTRKYVNDVMSLRARFLAAAG